MKRDVRNKRNELYEKSIILRELSYGDIKYEKSLEIKEEQDKSYKQWNFYDKIIKAQDKIKQNVNCRKK